MRFQIPAMLIALAAGVAASSAIAHHSIWGVFDPENEFSLTGVVTEIDWINPHIFIHLDVADDNGNVTAWRLETVPTAFLRRAGINTAMLRGEGGPITATGIVAHADPNMGWVHRITYADGHFYQLSNEGLDRGASQPSVPTP
jgi:hypothetical protein